MRKPIVGVFGPGAGATASDRDCAYELGVQIARHHWILLTGGRNVGVMDAACRGARSAGGLTLGILAGAEVGEASAALDIVLRTDLGSARNNINALSCDRAIACGMGWGTISEVALRLKAGQPVVLLNWDAALAEGFATMAPELVAIVNSPAAAIVSLQDSFAPETLT